MLSLFDLYLSTQFGLQMEGKVRYVTLPKTTNILNKEVSYYIKMYTFFY